MNLQQALSNGTQLLRDFKMPSAELDAELLLAHTVSKERTKLYSESDLPLTRAQHLTFNDLLARRASHEPVAYLTGEREFYGLSLYVNRHVLIPRPETEILVELALKNLAQSNLKSPKICDVGTGSGAIALAIAHNHKKARLTAVDISETALSVARKNARHLRLLQRINFKRSDLLSLAGGPFDMLVANLPYLTNAQILELPKGIREYEPNIALAGGPDGLHVYETLLKQISQLKKPSLVVLCEIGPNLKTGFELLVKKYLPKASTLKFYDDLAGRIRVAEIKFDMLEQ